MAPKSQNNLAVGKLLVKEAGRRAAVRLRKQKLATGWARPPSPKHLVALAPTRRSTDPASAKHILAGQFNLRGRYYDLGTNNPFEVMGEAQEGSKALHGFRWLRHLTGLQNDIASQTSLDLVSKWIQHFAHKLGPSSYAPETIAARLTAWCQNSSTIVQNADITFERKFIRTIVEDLQTLRSKISHMPASAERLQARIAAAQTSLALDLSLTRRNNAFKRLVEDCNEQILPDGGHISRNPEVLIDLIINLAAFIENCNSLSVAPPEELIHAMDRMFPTLSMFIHADGELAGFNGVGYIPPEELSLALRLRESKTNATLHAPHTGYERLAMGRTTIIADVGNPPPLPISQNAHAGTLGFELSSGRHRYVINTGLDRFGPEDYREISRQTTAHSTITINDQSSSVFSTSPRVKKWLGTALTTGPSKARSERADTEDSQSFRAAHNGYDERFGIIHERMLTLKEDGNLLQGVDRFFTQKGQPVKRSDLDATLRFHLHPAINPILDGEGHIMLTADRDDSWVFTTEGTTAEIIQSVYFADLGGPRETKAIVVNINPHNMPEIHWVLRRTGLGVWSR